MITMTYGVMPSREQFDAACLEVEDGDPPQACVADQGFPFENDKRVGSDRLTPDELWAELGRAKSEYDAGDEASGDWCSGVLGCLGFEWV